MPTSMLPDALAEGAARPATALTIAAARTNRLNTNGLPSEGRQQASQALLEIDLGGPAEDLLRTRDVWLADLRIVHGQRLEDDLALRPGHFQHRFRELENRKLVRVAEVDRVVLVNCGEGVEAVDHVVDVAEAARVRTVAEDRQRLVLERLAPERGGGAAVVGPHARAIGVEDSGDGGVHALLAVVRHRHRF